jgi:hypothetical protein
VEGVVMEGLAYLVTILLMIVILGGPVAILLTKIQTKNIILTIIHLYPPLEKVEPKSFAKIIFRNMVQKYVNRFGSTFEKVEIIFIQKQFKPISLNNNNHK